MPATVYQRLCLKKDSFSRKDLRRIANWINAIYRRKFTEELPKVEQKEGDRTFMVYQYPDEMIPIMDKIIDRFYKNKELIAKKHQKYLESLKNKSVARKKNNDKKFTKGSKDFSNKGKKKQNNQNKKIIKIDVEQNTQKIEIPTLTTFRKRKNTPLADNKDNN